MNISYHKTPKLGPVTHEAAAQHIPGQPVALLTPFRTTQRLNSPALA